MAERDSDDSDAPEEFTAKQAFEVDEELRKVQKENKTRVARERKERQRLWAQRKTPRPIKGIEGDKLLTEFEHHEEEEPQNMEATKNGMLPNDIVSLLAAREKQVFSSDSEEENPKEKLAHRKKKRRNSG
ncbi:hypothetical protein FRX31_027122 [Thalictrum thalictroides]|uniref:Uncharacterized protein n=1 Tax=Thalictrum thalictroides TaxID=46969 RepID=A0A7J6VG66_THATH|nr:hypothetical protein FRX31_027122 [Thalictrum thalictroides]